MLKRFLKLWESLFSLDHNCCSDEPCEQYSIIKNISSKGPYVNIINRLYENNFDCYIVGGFVRDILFNNTISDDVDFVTNATPLELSVIFSDRKVDLVGKSFLVTLVDEIQIATYRKDIFNNGRRTDCLTEPLNTIEEDLSRRDLTINAIAFSVYDGKFIDLFFGRTDLEDKKIKLIGDPYDRINEDNERILRACRFYALIDGSFEDKTFLALKECASFVENIPPDRIHTEIVKTMKTVKKASLFFEALSLIGALKYIFPSLVNCIDKDGGPHHDETIFTHCMDAGDNISPKYWQTKLAGYLHDVGKPLTATLEEGTHKLKFICHELEGAKQARKELTDLRFSKNEVNFISNSIELHMRSFNKKLSKRALKRFLVKIQEYNLSYKDWFRLFIADKKANRKSRNFTFGEVKSFISKIKYLYVNENIFSIKDLTVDGNDVMNILDIQQGKEVGVVLKCLFELCLENPEYNDRELLLLLIKSYRGE